MRQIGPGQTELFSCYFDFPFLFAQVRNSDLNGSSGKFGGDFVRPFHAADAAGVEVFVEAGPKKIFFALHAVKVKMVNRFVAFVNIEIGKGGTAHISWIDGSNP